MKSKLSNKKIKTTSTSTTIKKITTRSRKQKIEPLKQKDTTTTTTNRSTTRKRKPKKWFDDSEDSENSLDRPIKKQCVYFETTNSLDYSDDYSMDDSLDKELNELELTNELINRSSLSPIREELEKLSNDDDESTINSQSNLEINESSEEDSLLLNTTSLDLINNNNNDDNNNNELIPKLELPISSEDLLLSNENTNRFLFQLCSIYEILNTFKFELRLSTFRIEEFIAILQFNETSSLFSDIHIQLLKSLIRDDILNNVQFNSTEYKDSTSIHLYSIDNLTWPLVLNFYLQTKANGAQLTLNPTGDQMAKLILSKFKEIKTYSPLTANLEIKLLVLQYLCDLFLDTNSARDKISNIEQQKQIHDEHCRECSSFGKLLCCDNCSSAYHLGI